jgi:hypothetical protein
MRKMDFRKIMKVAPRFLLLSKSLLKKIKILRKSILIFQYQKKMPNVKKIEMIKK